MQNWRAIYFYKPHFARKDPRQRNAYITACNLTYTNIRRAAYVSPDSVRCPDCLRAVAPADRH